MGLFGFNYSKPGPGVDKDAPKKKGIFLFFELFFRKFWKLIHANMLYFICSIPMLLIVYFASPFLVSPLIEMLRAGGIEEEMLTMTSSALTVFFTVTIVSFLGSGRHLLPLRIFCAVLPGNSIVGYSVISKKNLRKISNRE